MARGLWHEGAGTLDQPGPSPGSRRRFFAIPTLIPAAFSACLAGIVASGIEVAFRSVPLYWFHRRLVGPDDGEMGRNAHVFQPCPKTFRQGAALAFPDIAEPETFGFEPAGGSHGGDEALPSGAEGGDEISLGVERIHTVGVVGALGVYDFRGIISGEKDSTFLDLDKRIYRPGEPGVLIPFYRSNQSNEELKGRLKRAEDELVLIPFYRSNQSNDIINNLSDFCLFRVLIPFYRSNQSNLTKLLVR